MKAYIVLIYYVKGKPDTVSGITYRHAGLNRMCHVLTICRSASVFACSPIHFTLARSLSHKEAVLFYKPAVHKLT